MHTFNELMKACTDVWCGSRFIRDPRNECEVSIKFQSCGFIKYWQTRRASNWVRIWEQPAINDINFFQSAALTTKKNFKKKLLIFVSHRTNDNVRVFNFSKLSNILRSAIVIAIRIYIIRLLALHTSNLAKNTAALIWLDRTKKVRELRIRLLRTCPDIEKPNLTQKSCSLHIDRARTRTIESSPISI